MNACSPGWIETDLTRPFAVKAGKSCEEMGMLPAEKGAIAPLYLALEATVTPAGTAYYYGSDAKRSPMHKYRSPGTEPHEGDDEPCAK